MREALIIFVIALAIGSVLNSVGGLGPLLGWKPDPTAPTTSAGEDGGSAESKVPEVKDATFEAEVLKSDKPVLVDFYAPWCGPCHMMAPIIDQVADRYESQGLKVVKMNTDDNQLTADKYQINSIPRLYIFKNGELIEKVEGAAPKAEVVALVEKTLALDPKPTQQKADN